MGFLNRIIVMGKNGTVGIKPFQDAAAHQQSDPGMELYTAYIHARQAGESLLRAHTLRGRDKDAADHHHTEAMHYLDQMADALGLDLVAREDVVTR